MKDRRIKALVKNRIDRVYKFSSVCSFLLTLLAVYRAWIGDTQGAILDLVCAILLRMK
jgi:hypothetical protein